MRRRVLTLAHHTDFHPEGERPLSQGKMSCGEPDRPRPGRLRGAEAAVIIVVVVVAAALAVTGMPANDALLLLIEAGLVGVLVTVLAGRGRLISTGALMRALIAPTP